MTMTTRQPDQSQPVQPHQVKVLYPVPRLRPIVTSPLLMTPVQSPPLKPLDGALHSALRSEVARSFYPFCPFSRSRSTICPSRLTEHLYLQLLLHSLLRFLPLLLHHHPATIRLDPPSSCPHATINRPHQHHSLRLHYHQSRHTHYLPPTFPRHLPLLSPRPSFGRPALASPPPPPRSRNPCSSTVTRTSTASSTAETADATGRASTCAAPTRRGAADCLSSRKTTSTA